MVIYVGNLRTDTTEQYLQEAFKRFGKVTHIRVMVDPVSHRGLGFAFVTMPNEGQAHKAIGQLHHTRLMDRAVIVCAAPQRGDRRSAARTEEVKVG
jgi:RNA recognition motif-containing protein